MGRILGLLCLGLALLAPTAAFAGPFDHFMRDKNGAWYGPKDFREATPEEVMEAAGSLQFEVSCPRTDPSPYAQDDERVVSVHLAKPGLGYRSQSVLAVIFSRAIAEAYAQCPIYTSNYNIALGDVGDIQIYGSPEEGAPARLLLKTGKYEELGWFHDRQMVDVYADDQAAAAADAQRLAEAQAAGAARANAAAARAQHAAQVERDNQAFWANARIFGLFVLAAIIFFNRGKLLRAFYYLTPHPAAHLVDRALEDGKLDIDAFAEAIRRRSRRRRSGFDLQARLERCSTC